MHDHFLKWGKFYLGLELLWTLAWFGLEVWFNVNDNGREFEQALFDTVLRLVGVFVIMRMIRALKDQSHHISWFNVFVVWAVGFIMARQTMILFRSPFYANAGSPFWQGLAGMILSGLAITFLELLWISAAYHYLTHHHPRGLFYYLYSFFGHGGKFTVEYQPHHDKSHLDPVDDFFGVDQKIRATPNISVRGLKK
jgi:hypothetical protein